MTAPAFRTYPPGAFSKTEAAYYLGISVRTLDQLQAQGRIIPREVGAKRLFLKTDLDAWLDGLPDWETNP